MQVMLLLLFCVVAALVLEKRSFGKTRRAEQERQDDIDWEERLKPFFRAIKES